MALLPQDLSPHSASPHARGALIGLGLVAALLLTGACASPDGTPLPAEPEVLLAPDEREDLPAATTTVGRLAAHYGLALEPEARERLRHLMTEGGAVSAQDIQEVLETSGFQVFVFRGTLDDTPTGIRYNLDRGRPLLLLLQRDGGKGAWVLLVGYDEAAQVYVLRRAGGGLAGTRYADLHRRWDAAGSFTILAVPDMQSELAP